MRMLLNEHLSMRKRKSANYYSLWGARDAAR